MFLFASPPLISCSFCFELNLIVKTIGFQNIFTTIMISTCMRPSILVPLFNIYKGIKSIKKLDDLFSQAH